MNITEINENLIEIRVSIGNIDSPPIELFRTLDGDWEVMHNDKLKNFEYYLRNMILSDIEIDITTKKRCEESSIYKDLNDQGKVKLRIF